MAAKKRSTKKQTPPKRITMKHPTRRFPLLRYSLYNPKLNPPSIEKVRDYFKGKSIEEIVKDRDPIFAPFFLYSEHVVNEIYKLVRTPNKLNMFWLKKLFGKIVPDKSSNRRAHYREKTLFTTRINCIVALGILSRKYPPWGTKQRENLQREFDEWGKEIEGEKGKPITRNSFEQIYYDAIKEFEWFKPLLNGSTREEKLDDFLKMLKEFVEYHRGNDAPLKYRPSYAVDIFYDAVRRKKLGH